MKLTVGICTKDRDQKLGQCLEALKKQCQYIDRLIVVEDISQQQHLSLQLLQKFFGKLSHVILEYRTVKFSNIARSRTKLISMVKDDILVFIDDDVFVGNESLKKVKQFFLKNADTSLLIGKMLPVHSMNPISKVDCVYFSQGILRFNRPHRIKMCPFSFVALNITQIKKQRTKILRFDSQFPIGEDIDFSLRLSQSGQKLFFNPSIVNYHYYDTSFFPFVSKKFTHGEYIYMLYQKHKQQYRDPATLPISTSILELPLFLWEQSWGATKYYAGIHQFSFLEKIIVLSGEVATLLGLIKYKLHLH